MSTIQNVVAEHYNSRPDLGKSKRGESKIINLRMFNNWLKGVLISKYTRKGNVVLDLCCGKGGDLLKWKNAEIGYLVCADHAENSVRSAVSRYNTIKPNFNATFMVADCCHAVLSDHFPSNLNNLAFDLVNCQFSLHYSFETRERASGLLRNVVSRLNPGGYFIGTIPNANMLVKKLRASGGQGFGNNIYSVSFPQREKFPSFGARYDFFLEDAVENCPEYLVHLDILKELCKNFGLEFVESQRFHDFYAEYIRFPEYKQLFDRMVNSDFFPKNEWEALEIYITFVFRKTGHAISLEDNPFSHTAPEVKSEDDIIKIATS